MSAVTLHRTNVKGHSEVKVDGSRFSVDKIGNAYFVAQDGEFVGEFGSYAEALDYIYSTVVNAQHARQNKVIEGFGSPCYDGSCLYAAGPVCVCGCAGAGHGLGFTEVKF